MSEHEIREQPLCPRNGIHPGDYDGEFWIRYQDRAALYPEFSIDRADPKVTIHREVVDGIRRGPHHPDVDLDGDILRIRATNRTVVYQLVLYDRSANCYYAEWPD
jgi:hypothetical protein